jgi:hypothetical protein
MSRYETKSWQFNINAGQYTDICIRVTDNKIVYILQIAVEQNRGNVDDIQCEIMDSDNFNIYKSNKVAIKAGASAFALPDYETISSSRVKWANLIFSPLQKRDYYLVLDNTYSTLTAKTVSLTISKHSFESRSQRVVREGLTKLGWTEPQQLFQDAEENFTNGKLATSCDNLRKALVVIWIKVCETLTRKNISFDVSKTPDIGILKEKINPYSPEYMIGLISQAWSLASELSHSEKRGGKEPPLSEAFYALSLVYNSAAYLLSLILPQTPIM